MSGPIEGPVFQGRDFYGNIHVNVGAVDVQVPWQVPLRPGAFVDRKETIAEVDHLTQPRSENAAGAPSIIILRGAKGIGKTAFGCYWAHVNAHRFRDGQLYVDFREHRHAGASPVGAILGELLRSLGLRNEMIPVATSERAKLFRTETAGKQLLLLLDDVQQASEVTQLLPTGVESVVLVTTSQSMRELLRIGGRPVQLPPLGRDSAEELLTDLIGDDRAQGESAAVERLVGLCGGLPVALGICGARLAETSHSVEWLVNLLADDAERLKEIEYDEDRSLRAIFDQGYGSLTESAKMLHRRLGMFPGTTIASVAAAAAANFPVDQTIQLLDELAAACLIDEVGDQRFRYHDLLHAHARVVAKEQDPEAERDATVERVVDYYVAAAQRMDHAIAADRLRLSDAPPPPPVGEKPHAIAADALAWFESERPTLLAVVQSAFDRELDDQLWRIGEAVWLAYRSHGHWEEAAEVFGLATKAARRSGDVDAEARMRSQMARAQIELGEREQAMEELEACCLLMEGSSNRALAASIVEWTGVLHFERQEDKAAVAAFEEALAMFEQAGVPRGVVMQRYLLGRALTRIGDAPRAVEELRWAVARIDSVTDQFLYGRVLWRLGTALAEAGEVKEAREKLDEAARVLRSHSAHLYEARARESLANLERRAGDVAAEARQLEAALAIYAEFRAPQARKVRDRLAELRP